MSISDVVMVDHLKGKKHQRLAKFQEKVEQDVEKSVYVRGFHPSITMKALHSRFTEFGPVDHVFIHRDKVHLYPYFSNTDVSPQPLKH